MSSFFNLKAVVHEHQGCVEQLLMSLTAANDPHQREIETNAATKIQSVARMRAQRKCFSRVLRCIIHVQRCFRGYRDRKKTLQERIKQQIVFNRAVFDHFATLIQSRFRGFLLRKRHCDFYARKKYLQDIIDRNESVRRDADALFRQQQIERERSLQESQRNAFVQATKNLHHLLSTASVTGVFRPPLSMDGAKTIFGTNIEDDLRQAAAAANAHRLAGTGSRKFKPDLPTTTSSAAAQQGALVGSAGSSSGAAASSPVKHVPRAPSQSLKPKFEMSTSALQNAAPFQVERHEISLQQSVDKKLQEAIHGSGNLFLARKVDPLRFETTINAETPFVERSALPPKKR